MKWLIAVLSIIIAVQTGILGYFYTQAKGQDNSTSSQIESPEPAANTLNQTVEEQKDELTPSIGKSDAESDASEAELQEEELTDLPPEGEMHEEQPITDNSSEETDFRNVRWGMTKEEVKAAETAELKDEDETGLLYGTNLSGIQTNLIYTFDYGLLTKAEYKVAEYFENIDEFVATADMIYNTLKQKYGEPHKENSDHAYKTPFDDADISWQTKELNIYLNTFYGYPDPQYVMIRFFSKINAAPNPINPNDI